VRRQRFIATGESNKDAIAKGFFVGVLKGDGEGERRAERQTDREKRKKNVRDLRALRWCCVCLDRGGGGLCPTIKTVV
jgi:hypothetical protein